MYQKENKTEIKKFLIKLVAITFAIIVTINITYNLIFSEKLENLSIILSLNEKENIEQIKDKIRIEIGKGLKKEKMINDEDKKLLYNLYKKLKKEVENLETN